MQASGVSLTSFEEARKAVDGVFEDKSEDLMHLSF